MKTKSLILSLAVGTAMVFALATLPGPVSADHSWGSYHWARTANPFTLKVVDSNTSNWDSPLNLAISDWSASSVMNLVRENGSTTTSTRRQCRMVAGKIRSCNSTYGNNGWLGLASINISGSHITQGTSKMNDTYFNSGGYSTTNRRHVMCQELGHTFGLDHQSESGADLNTCMDYSNALDNPSPNSHDYQQLQSIYAHLDGFTTIASRPVFDLSDLDENPDAPYKWGYLIKQSANGRSSTYERTNVDGSRTLTFVFWTHEAAENCRSCDHRYEK